MNKDDKSIDIDSIRWLLLHLYDNAALSSAAEIADSLGLPDLNPQDRAQSLHTLVLDAIEFLRPPRSEGMRSQGARAYSVLWLRYVEGMAIPQVCEELALSERQTHRELRSAEAKIGEFLTAQMQPGLTTPAAEIAPANNDPLAVEPVKSRPLFTELRPVLDAAIRTIGPLTGHLHAQLEVNLPENLGKAFLDEGILRQLFIQLLSQAMQQAQDKVVYISATATASITTVDVAFSAPPVTDEHYQSLAQLADTINVVLTREYIITRCRISLAIPLRQPRTVLIVEDSPAAIELCRRYLEPTGEWRVVGVSEPRLAYDMARSLQPHLIILDLLMPGTDGWTVLNLLHAQPETAHIPVIVCSVFQDAMLAEALGAVAYLRKPLSQAALLATIRRFAREEDNPA